MLAMQVMSALSQQTRLDVFTKLVAASPEGMASGQLAAATQTAPSAMSAHLAILSRAGLVKSVKIGKSVIYRAQVKPIESLREFLADTCGVIGD